MEGPTGVWLIGGLGSLATTLVAGCRAIAADLVAKTGILTSRDEFQPLGLTPIDRLLFGAHEIRRGDLVQSATEIGAQNSSLRPEWIEHIRKDLEDTSSRIVPGISRGGGAAIERLDERGSQQDARTSRDLTDQLTADLRSFRQQNQLRRLIVVNLASTEPPTSWTEPYRSLEALEASLDELPPGSLRPGLLYAYAALQCDAAYLNFTPSSSALCPATEELALRRGLPYMGNDGKTGETLVKSALAPMFKYRNLSVDSWFGYNLLGNRDGEVLSDEENKRSKVESKDAVLSAILGYRPQTRVGIDFVRSLSDRKVAWDFIHFRGFLDHAMSMQFTWQGCDSILAAPVVLDLVRLTEAALVRGLTGPLVHLACFFKSPIHCEEHDLHRQFALLAEHVSAHAAKTGSGS